MFSDALQAERIWMAAAGLCMIAAAAALLWRWNVEAAFVAATVGAVCWFLSLRNRLKKSIVEERDVDEDEDDEETDEDQ